VFLQLLSRIDFVGFTYKNYRGYDVLNCLNEKQNEAYCLAHNASCHQIEQWILGQDTDCAGDFDVDWCADWRQDTD
jgi:hypothetical protein